MLWSMTQPVKLSFNEAKKENKTTAKKELDLCTSVSVNLRGREEVTSLRKQLQLGKSNQQSVVEEG